MSTKTYDEKTANEFISTINELGENKGYEFTPDQDLIEQIMTKLNIDPHTALSILDDYVTKPKSEIDGVDVVLHANDSTSEDVLTGKPAKPAKSAKSAKPSKPTKQQSPQIECDVCCEPIKKGNALVFCTKCESSRCKNCVFEYAKTKKIFPTCDTPGCDMIFDEFALVASQTIQKTQSPTGIQLTNAQINQMKTIVKEILFDKAKSEHLQQAVQYISENGYKTKNRITAEYTLLKIKRLYASSRYQGCIELKTEICNLLVSYNNADSTVTKRLSHITSIKTIKTLAAKYETKLRNEKYDFGGVSMYTLDLFDFIKFFRLFPREKLQTVASGMNCTIKPIPFITVFPSFIDAHKHEGIRFTAGRFKKFISDKGYKLYGGYNTQRLYRVLCYEKRDEFADIGDWIDYIENKRKKYLEKRNEYDKKLNTVSKYERVDGFGNVVEGLSQTTSSTSTPKPKPEQKSVFVFRCSWNELPTEDDTGASSSGSTSVEPCKGFLTTQWNCTVCKRKTCKECHSKRTETHVCLESDVETAKLIMSATKPCPNCGTRIQRSYGCNHMFCMECKTSFDYSTGLKIADSKNTNPHYFEWLKSQGRTHEIDRSRADGGCNPNALDALPPSYNLMYICYAMGVELEIVICLFNLKEACDAARGRTTAANYQGKNQLDMRDKFQLYVCGKMTEQKLREHVFVDYRISQRNTHNIANTNVFVFAGTEILISIVNSESREEFDTLIKRMHELREYVNEHYLRIARVLGYKTRCYITKKFEFIPKVTDAVLDPKKFQEYKQQIQKYVKLRETDMLLFKNYDTFDDGIVLPKTDFDTKFRIIRSFLGDIYGTAYRSGLNNYTEVISNKYGVTQYHYNIRPNKEYVPWNTGTNPLLFRNSDVSRNTGFSGTPASSSTTERVITADDYTDFSD